jgi:hypothetical protein
MQEIIKDGVIFARIIFNEDWYEGLSFFSKDEEYIQVGTWNYSSGKELAAHMHNQVQRTIFHTQEVLYIKQGKILASVLDMNDELIQTMEIKEGEIIILLNGGHGYKVLEDNTLVLEIKNGPYLGAEIDRRRL